MKITEAEKCIEHVHMLLEIHPKTSVCVVVEYIKGKRELMIYEKFGKMKFKYSNREFWYMNYCVDSDVKNAAKIKE